MFLDPFFPATDFFTNASAKAIRETFFFTLTLANLFKVFAKHFVFLRYSNGVLANFIGPET